MLVCFYSARRFQILATMAFVRRFCSSAEFGYHHSTGKCISRGLCFASQLGSSRANGTSSFNRGGKHSTLHIYFSKLRPAMISKETMSQEALFSQHRSRSLHWDKRETSLMCLQESSEGSAISNQEGLKEDIKEAELPVLVRVEGNTINHVLSMLTSTLPVHDSLRDITATLRRLSATMHVQSVLETAAKPREECSDDIIIRNQPITNHSSDNFVHTAPTDALHKLNPFNVKRDFLNPRLNNSRFIKPDAPSVEKLKPQSLSEATGRQARAHLYFNKVYHVPMVASVPEPNLQSSANDRSDSTAGVHPSHHGDILTPPDQNNHRPSKEQILVMHERLSNELPNFLQEPHDFSMYADTLEFDNRILRIKTRGLPAYKACLQSMKSLGTTYMTGSSMEVLRITADLDQDQIQARWRIKGVPLHSYIIRPWRRNHPHRYFDAFSTFDVGTDGLIHRHKLDKVMPNPSDKVRSPSLAVRIGIALGVVRNPALSPDCMVSKPLAFIQHKTNPSKL
ncbi:uncharacterized protein LOC117302903 [Asterias rubens]|uniref:uncharacterized protein LOC117302903 n=1 Tax=Asterias rubens TaxID=7604 RepID=UPI0014559EA1|nr:uncharacterized protein LOC117302903 [Asterias rubens]